MSVPLCPIMALGCTIYKIPVKFSLSLEMKHRTSNATNGTEN